MREPQELRDQSATWWAPACPDEQPDGVLELCSPPEPPFVAALPLAGIAHGGETHIMRTWWPGATAPPGGFLGRLQSKHVAIYARVATDRRVYPLQADDNHNVTVDVQLWTDLREESLALLALMDDSGVWPSSQREAIATVRPPAQLPLSLIRDWNSLTRLMRKHSGCQWWPIFSSLIPIRRTPCNDQSKN